MLQLTALLLDITSPGQTPCIGRERLITGNAAWKKQEPAWKTAATAAPFMQQLIAVLLV